MMTATRSLGTRGAHPWSRAAAALLLALTAGGCTADGQAGQRKAPGADGLAAAAARHETSTPSPTATIAVTVGGRAPGKSARLDARVVVAATLGRLTRVVVTGPEGAKVKGGLSAEGKRWESTRGTLAPATAYRLKAEAVDDAGSTTTRTFAFRTLKPTKVMKASVSPLDGDLVGVGHPVAVYFSEKVTDRAAVEKRLTVTAEPPVEGAWHWYGDTEVHYRPEDYWQAGSRVSLHADLAGVDAGEGVWGLTSRRVSFTIGDQRISKVSSADHTMTVFVNGKAVRRMPISTGRKEFPTSSGVHVVMSKAEEYFMDSATIGIPRNNPGGYYKKVLWNVRISNSGEFVHSAPWSLGSQGQRNVSHGCVNASPADAKWFYAHSLRGDVVEVTGTPRRMQQGNGFADWNMPWSEWVDGSAAA